MSKFSSKKEQTMPHAMGEPQKHYVKWMKPDTYYILHDSIYMKSLEKTNR